MTQAIEIAICGFLILIILILVWWWGYREGKQRNLQEEKEVELLKIVYKMGQILRECPNCGEWHSNWKKFIDSVDILKAHYSQEKEIRESK